MVTAGIVRAAVNRSNPAAAQSVSTHLSVNEVVAPIIIALWLWLAWAHSRRWDSARLGLAALFGLITMSGLAALADGAARYFPAGLIYAGVLWLIALASLALIFTPASNRYFRPQEAVPV